MSIKNVRKNLEDLRLKKEEIDLLIVGAEFYRKRRLSELRANIFTTMFKKRFDRCRNC